MLKTKILIVEDELLIAKDISIILERENHETKIGITTIEEAITVLETEHFDLILIDVKLRNNSDGVGLGSYLLKKENIPYVYITSNSDKTTLSRIKDSRPHGIIIKPYKPIDIVTTVSIVLNNYKHKQIDVLRSVDLVNDEVPFILKGVVEYIDSNINERLDINDLSKKTKWSNQHFIRIFTKFIGHTPYQYILKKKMEKAIVLITDTDLSMKAIAFDLGFQSYGNFCKIFKRELRMKPDEYRNRNNVNQYINKKNI
jgi:AraC-like DNA-binding protein